MNLDPGVCFQIQGDGYHLKVVVTFPDKDANVLLFGLTGVENVNDRLCVFDAGDHPFITKPSAIAYRRRWLLPYSGFDASRLKFHQRFPCEHLVRIIEGAHLSEELEPRYQRALPKCTADLAAYIAKVNYIHGA